MTRFADVQYCIYAKIVGGSEKVQNYAEVIYGWSLENNKVKEKGMIVLSSAYKGGGRTDLSCNTEAADHCTVRLQITLGCGS